MCLIVGLHAALSISQVPVQFKSSCNSQIDFDSIKSNDHFYLTKINIDNNNELVKTRALLQEDDSVRNSQMTVALDHINIELNQMTQEINNMDTKTHSRIDRLLPASVRVLSTDQLLGARTSAIHRRKS